MSHRIRIKDIARRAGVSTGTVDRVLHNRGKVSPEAKEKVLEAINALDYQPNIIASTLAYNRAIRISVLLPDWREDPYWEWPKLGVEKAYQSLKHYGLVLDINYFRLFHPRSFNAQAQAILRGNPDAILFSPIFLKEGMSLLRACQQRQIPTVLINTDFEEEKVLCYVGQDSFQSGVLAGKLLDLSLPAFGDILVVNLDKETTNARHLLDKEKGIRQYFHTAYPEGGFNLYKIDIPFFEDHNQLKAALMAQLQYRPNLKGIFITNSRAYHALDSLDGQLPKHIKVVGFDLLPQNQNYLKQGAISFLINQNPTQQGYLGLTQVASHFIFKKKVERILHLPLDIVVAENLAYYIKKEQEFELAI